MQDNTLKILILGANGFIGFHLTSALLKHGYQVRAFSNKLFPLDLEQYLINRSLELCEGSIFDKNSLCKALNNIDIVCDCTSFSVPSTSNKYLKNEVHITLQAMELLLSSMVSCGVKTLVYPSSGGTIYGDTNNRPAKEIDSPLPESGHGLGKLMCEEMIHFYHRIHGLNYKILRISNTYGATHLRKMTQGVVDVFLEKILAKQPLKVWGSLETIRDYIFIDDLTDAIIKLIALTNIPSLIVNVGTGEGRSLSNIISTIENVIGSIPKWNIDQNKFSGLTYSVLDISKLYSLICWHPKYNITTGIAESWRRKLVQRNR